MAASQGDFPTPARPPQRRPALTRPPLTGHGSKDITQCPLTVFVRKACGVRHEPCGCFSRIDASTHAGTTGQSGIPGRLGCHKTCVR
ncbi:hypothetical protein COCON_G00160680 [Conger conger]|uniref:Uncharacterized protein n=1 Tax=Conger conger TaxID=82655 RepID=A0A9Q1DA32_CONCO|nr:hypothetical protein COCON_G00160680 [Conger conger]